MIIEQGFALVNCEQKLLLSRLNSVFQNKLTQ